MSQEKKVFETPEYDLICAVEAANVNRRFIPYSVGSPSRASTYTGQKDRVNLLFFSDSHIDYEEPEEISGAALDNVRRTIAFANDSKVPFDALIHTGDVITPMGKYKKEDSLENASVFFTEAKKSRYPFVFSKGNHDLNDWSNYPGEVFTDRDWSELFFDYAEENFGIVRQTKKNGEKSTWHYLDLDAKKIRIISVDPQDTDKTVVFKSGEAGEALEGTCKLHGGKSFYISNEQINWIASTALNFDDKAEKDWGVILAFHQTQRGENPYHEDAIDKLFALCEALNHASVYDNEYVNADNAFFNWSVHADFTRYANLEKKPHIVCVLLGHMHEDIYKVSHGLHLIWTLNNSAIIASGDARIARVPGTVTQNSFDIVNIDTRERRIRLFRYGAGQDCYGVGGDRFLPDGLQY